MKKQNVLDALKIDDSTYKKVCDTIAIDKESEDFPPSQFADFAMVSEWFQDNKSLSVKSAMTRYQELPQNQVSPVIDEIAPLIDDAAGKIMEKIIEVAHAEQASMTEELRAAIRSRVYQYSRDPAYKERFMAYINGETVDEVGKPYPALIPQDSTALPPGSD